MKQDNLLFKKSIHVGVRFLPMTSRWTFQYLVGDLLKSTRHLYVPASPALIPISVSTAVGSVRVFNWAKSSFLPPPAPPEPGVSLAQILPSASGISSRRSKLKKKKNGL